MYLLHSIDELSFTYIPFQLWNLKVCLVHICYTRVCFFVLNCLIYLVNRFYSAHFLYQTEPSAETSFKLSRGNRLKSCDTHMSWGKLENVFGIADMGEMRGTFNKNDSFGMQEVPVPNLSSMLTSSFWWQLFKYLKCQQAQLSLYTHTPWTDPSR